MLPIFILLVAAAIFLQLSGKKDIKNSTQAADFYQNIYFISNHNNVPNASNAIINHAEKIINLAPQSIYADFAYLEIAKHFVLNNDFNQALIHLKKVANESTNKNLKDIAKLRLARIELALQNFDEAISILHSIKINNYKLSSNSLLGDAYLQKKDYRNAEKHWKIAIKQAQKKELNSIKNLLQMKLDNLNALKYYM